jgi:uncharacterized protein (DUF1684 family)
MPACAPKPDPAYRQEILAWRARRLERLRADDGYLALAGLLWLHDGENTFGSAPTNDLVFPAAAPAQAGVLLHHGGETIVRAFPGTSLTVAGQPVDEMHLVADTEGEPTQLALGTLRFLIIRRGDRFGVRLRDPASAIRQRFHGIDSYDIDPAYRVTARFEPYDPPKKIPVVNIVGTVDTMPSPGALLFRLHGAECRLDPVIETPGDTLLFVIFRDATSGAETYASGRFLYTNPPRNGVVVADFNRAYNPPCAFSPYTTCPLPPPQNELRVAVRAGEKKYEP